MLFQLKSTPPFPFAASKLTLLVNTIPVSSLAIGAGSAESSDAATGCAESLLIGISSVTPSASPLF